MFVSTLSLTLVISWLAFTSIAGDIAFWRIAVRTASWFLPLWLSPLAKLSDCVIRTAAFTKNPCNETVAKRIPELCIIEALYISILQGREEKYAKMLAAANEELRKNKF